jgi:hypothetical protein
LFWRMKTARTVNKLTGADKVLYNKKYIKLYNV